MFAGLQVVALGEDALAPGFVRKTQLLLTGQIADVQPQLCLNLNRCAAKTSWNNGDFIKQMHRERRLRAKQRIQQQSIKLLLSNYGSAHSRTTQHYKQYTAIATICGGLPLRTRSALASAAPNARPRRGADLSEQWCCNAMILAQSTVLRLFDQDVFMK